MEKNNRLKKVGRKPKVDPAVFRYSISLTEKENSRFISLFEQSGMRVKAQFITHCIFQQPVKTIKIDKGTVDFYMRLTTLHSQFRSVGVNYNQIVKLLYRNFSEKKAAAYLFKLEKETTQLASLCRQILDLINEFDDKYNVK